MTLDEMKTLYAKTMHTSVHELDDAKSFTLRVWDGMDGCWCNVTSNVDLAFALRAWCENTNNGTKNTGYHDIDYYRIFPADTHMLYSGDFTMRGDG